MIKIGFIDYYLDEWHANNYPAMIREKSNGEMEVAYAYGMIPSPISGMTSEEWCEKYKVTQCSSIEDVIEKSDVLVVLSPDNCEMHEQLCELPLKSGKRTYVDKTFAPSKEAAERIFAIAESYQTPCYSTSALRFASEYEKIKGRYVKAAAFWGPNDLETYSIHQIEPMCMLMQGNVKRVMTLAKEKWTQMQAEWTDGRCTSFVCTGGDAPFAALLCLEDGTEHVTVTSDFFGGFIDNLVRFFKTGAIPVEHSETVEIMAIREAAIKAADHPGEWIYL